MIHDQPQILPIAQIEPGFGDIMPVAREVPCGHGYIDNLYLTGDGGIVLVEAKLWAIRRRAAKWWRRRSTMSLR